MEVKYRWSFLIDDHSCAKFRKKPLFQMPPIAVDSKPDILSLENQFKETNVDAWNNEGLSDAHDQVCIFNI